MPKVIEALAPRTGRPAKYDWDLFLDGQARLYTQGEDFDSDPKSFVSQARRQAAERGLSLHARTVGPDSVQLQAAPKDEDDSPEVDDTDL